MTAIMPSMSEELGWFYYYNLNYMKWYTLFEWALRLYMANSSVTTTKSKKKKWII